MLLVGRREGGVEDVERGRGRKGKSYTRVAFVGVGFEIAFGGLEIVLGDNLVQGIFATP